MAGATVATGTAIVPSLAAEQKATRPTRDSAAKDAQVARMRMQWGGQIPLRDGTRLSATLYLPPNKLTPAPCIFVLTPYGAHSNHSTASYFTGQGYPYLVVDGRGRGNSEGTFRPFIQEAKDGFDIVEWIARQPFCNGKVTMFSSSYRGYVQWATAKEFPPHLATIVPLASSAPGIDFPMRNNVWYPYLMRWCTLVSGRTVQEQLFNDQEFWREQFRECYESGRPFKEVDAMVGNPSQIFQEFVSHPRQDAYWDACKPTAQDYAKLNLPILSVTGAYDADQPGALHYYHEHMRHASPEAAAKHYLVIGPWNHRGALAPSPDIGRLKFGPAASVDVMQLHADWYRWTMQGGPKPALLRKRVSYYVAGAEKWRYAETLEGVTARLKPLYLDSNGAATTIFASGNLSESVGRGTGDTYIYDPRDRSIAAVESKLDDPFTILRPTFPTDEPTEQALVYANEGKVLIYHSAPFSQETEVSGFFKLTAWLSIDQPDTDFMATVYEVTPDGGSVLLTMDLMRARYRESLREEKLVRTKQALRYDFDRFTFISRRLGKGSRLRLVMGPVNSIHFQRNFNSGGVVAEESIDDARPVTVTLLHDATHPSVLYLPLGHSEARES